MSDRIKFNSVREFVEYKDKEVISSSGFEGFGVVDTEDLEQLDNNQMQLQDNEFRWGKKIEKHLKAKIGDSIYELSINYFSEEATRYEECWRKDGEFHRYGGYPAKIERLVHGISAERHMDSSCNIYFVDGVCIKRDFVTPNDYALDFMDVKFMKGEYNVVNDVVDFDKINVDQYLESHPWAH